MSKHEKRLLGFLFGILVAIVPARAIAPAIPSVARWGMIAVLGPLVAIWLVRLLKALLGEEDTSGRTETTAGGA